MFFCKPFQAVFGEGHNRDIGGTRKGHFTDIIGHTCNISANCLCRETQHFSHFRNFIYIAHHLLHEGQQRDMYDVCIPGVRFMDTASLKTCVPDPHSVLFIDEGGLIWDNRGSFLVKKALANLLIWFSSCFVISSVVGLSIRICPHLQDLFFATFLEIVWGYYCFRTHSKEELPAESVCKGSESRKGLPGAGGATEIKAPRESL